MLAQLGHPDMRTPIAQALAFPERIDTEVPALELVRRGSLTFEAPDRDRFPCLDLAYRALGAGGTAPAVLNAANEVAVAAFLGGRIRFTDIAPACAEALARLPARPAGTLDDALAADAEARAVAASVAQASGAPPDGSRHQDPRVPRRARRARRVPRARPLLRRALVRREGPALLGRIRPRRLVAAHGPRRHRVGDVGRAARRLREDAGRARRRRSRRRTCRAPSIGKASWKRIAIVAAGPIANLLLAVLLFAGTFVVRHPRTARAARRPAGGHGGGCRRHSRRRSRRRRRRRAGAKLAGPALAPAAGVGARAMRRSRSSGPTVARLRRRHLARRRARAPTGRAISCRRSGCARISARR